MCIRDSGNDDQWQFPAIALRETVIRKGDRIAQFEIQKIQPDLEFEEVENLYGENRGCLLYTSRCV